MIALIQRVSQASVSVSGKIIGEIQHGMLVFLGVEPSDSRSELDRLVNKVCNYRIFNDELGKMNLNVSQVNGEILVVSQFTLMADTKKGNRPGFSFAGDPQASEMLYDAFITQVSERGIRCASGQFGADMQVALINDGPATFWLQV